MGQRIGIDIGGTFTDLVALTTDGRVLTHKIASQHGQGGMVNNGELNVPLALRAINSVVAVQNALVPATPAEVTAAAKKYISSSLDLTTAAMRNVSIEEGNRLNKIAMTLLLRSPMCADCLTDRCR